MDIIERMYKRDLKVIEIFEKTGLIFEPSPIVGFRRIANPQKHNGFVFFLLAMSLENDYSFKLEDGKITFSEAIIDEMIDKELEVI